MAPVARHALRALVLAGLWVAFGGMGLAHAQSLAFQRSITLSGKAHEVSIQDDLVYVATDTGMTVLDASNPPSPVVLGSYNRGTSAKTQGIAVRGSYAYLAAQSAGLEIVDISSPASPQRVGAKMFPSPAWDVALKDEFAYVVTFGGEMYVVNVSNPASPTQVKVLGLLAWHHPGLDAAQITKLNAQVKSGGAKSTAVYVTGSKLFTVDWNYGRMYYYDVTSAANPIFRGTHYAPFLLDVVADPAKDVVYMLAAYGRWSGIYTVPISALEDPVNKQSTRYNTCSACRFLKSNSYFDQGGLGLSPGTEHLFYGGGRAFEFHVVDVSDPATLHDLASANTGSHSLGLAEKMGFASLGDYIYVGAGAQGLQIYRFPGASE